MISFCWETVRVYGDADPAHLEAAIRHVLSKRGGTWRVSLARSGSEWRIRFEQPQETQGRAVAVVTVVALPLPTGTVLRTLVAQAIGQGA